MSVEQTSIVIPSSPADIKDLYLVIKQISDSKERVEAEVSYQREAIKTLAEKYDIDAKYIRNLVVDYHKDRFDQKADEFEQYADLYEKVIVQGAKLANPSSISVDDEDDMC